MPRPVSKVTRVVVSGPLAPFGDVYEARLEASGYTALSIVNELRQVAHLSGWLMARGLSASDVSVDRLEEFVVERRAVKGTKACSRQGLMSLREVMVAAGVVTESTEAAPPVLPVDVLLGRFGRHLVAERGLAPGTVDAYVARARRFVEACCVDGDVAVVTTADVTGAVRSEAARVSVGSAQYFVAGVRSFLRFCFIEGLIDVDLADAALAVTGRRTSSLPRGISDTDAAALVGSCDRRRSDGRRDYAILLALVRLGLRAGEVAALSLDDIDWRAGEVVVHLGYAGEYHDPETGLQYLRARYYDPTTGQFLTRDPIESVTREAYGYVSNNPLNGTDPLGLVGLPIKIPTWVGQFHRSVHGPGHDDRCC